jgi:Homeodomain-like domain
MKRSTKYASEFPPEDLERRIGGNVPKVYGDVKAGLYLDRRTAYGLSLGMNCCPPCERLICYPWRRYTSPYRDVIRAKIVLLAAEGLPNDRIAARLDLPRQIVSKWRKRFFQERLPGLEEQSRGGRPARFPPLRRRPGQGTGL